MKTTKLVSNERFEDGSTWLHLAAAKGLMDEVLSMINKGVNPNITDALGRTPLFYADDCCQPILIEAGADLDIVDLFGKKAFCRLSGMDKNLNPTH